MVNADSHPAKSFSAHSTSFLPFPFPQTRLFPFRIGHSPVAFHSASLTMSGATPREIDTKRFRQPLQDSSKYCPPFFRMEHQSHLFPNERRLRASALPPPVLRFETRAMLIRNFRTCSSYKRPLIPLWSMVSARTVRRIPPSTTFLRIPLPCLRGRIEKRPRDPAAVCHTRRFFLARRFPWGSHGPFLFYSFHRLSLAPPMLSCLKYHARGLNVLDLPQCVSLVNPWAFFPNSPLSLFLFYQHTQPCCFPTRTREILPDLSSWGGGAPPSSFDISLQLGWPYGSYNRRLACFKKPGGSASPSGSKAPPPPPNRGLWHSFIFSCIRRARALFLSQSKSGSILYPACRQFSIRCTPRFRVRRAHGAVPAAQFFRVCPAPDPSSFVTPLFEMPFSLFAAI